MLSSVRPRLHTLEDCFHKTPPPTSPNSDASCPQHRRLKCTQNDTGAVGREARGKSALCTLMAVYNHLCKPAHNIRATDLSKMPLLCAPHHELPWSGVNTT